ncbi:MAG: YdcH family protein [Kiloniellales bacterium]|nr:YdcH family protein [Kiloniellales bacterium]
MTEHLRRVSTRAPSASIFNRYRALAQTHQSLEEKLEAETSRPAADDQLIRRIKKRKLLIKDEMASIERLLEAINAETVLVGEAAEIIPLPLPAGGEARSGNVPERVPAA